MDALGCFSLFCVYHFDVENYFENGYGYTKGQECMFVNQ